MEVIIWVELEWDDKKNSVVNLELRVHDVNNLYVNGSSNFVTGGYTNPTFNSNWPLDLPTQYLIQ